MEATQTMEAGQTCMTTRAKNATTHPGNIVLENTRIRTKEEVQQEKLLKKEKKAAKEKKIADAEALQAVGKAFVAQHEMEEDAVTTNPMKKFPHESKHEQRVMKTDKGKHKVEHVVLNWPKMKPGLVQQAEAKKRSNQDANNDTDRESSPSPPSKKVKVNAGQMTNSLRRTETTLDSRMVVDSDEDCVSKTTKHEHLQSITSDGDTEENEELTPRPKKKEDQHFGSEYSDVDQNEQNQTPPTLKRSRNKKLTLMKVVADNTPHPESSGFAHFQGQRVVVVVAANPL